MSGLAEALFTCGAMVEKQAASGYRYNAACDESATVPLYEEYYLGFIPPDDWHIDIERGIIRCPEHCDVILNEIGQFDHWEDAP